MKHMQQALERAHNLIKSVIINCDGVSPNWMEDAQLTLARDGQLLEAPKSSERINDFPQESNPSSKRKSDASCATCAQRPGCIFTTGDGDYCHEFEHVLVAIPQTWFTLDTYVGEDGVPVVHVQTEDMLEDGNGPICRVYLNDGAIYENPMYCGCGEFADSGTECATCRETRAYLSRLRASDASDNS